MGLPNASNGGSSTQLNAAATSTSVRSTSCGHTPSQRELCATEGSLGPMPFASALHVLSLSRLASALHVLSLSRLSSNLLLSPALPLSPNQLPPPSPGGRSLSEKRATVGDGSSAGRGGDMLLRWDAGDVALDPHCSSLGRPEKEARRREQDARRPVEFRRCFGELEGESPSADAFDSHVRRLAAFRQPGEWPLMLQREAASSLHGPATQTLGSLRYTPKFCSSRFVT